MSGRRAMVHALLERERASEREREAAPVGKQARPETSVAGTAIPDSSNDRA